MRLETHDWRLHVMCGKLENSPCCLGGGNVPSRQITGNFIVLAPRYSNARGSYSVDRNFLSDRSMVRSLKEIIEEVFHCIDAAAHEHIYVACGSKGEDWIIWDNPPVIEYTSTALTL